MIHTMHMTQLTPLSIVNTLIASTGNRPASLWMPEQASTVAPQIDLMFDLITWMCYFFFVLITVVLVYFVWKYRRSPDNHAGNAQGPTHNTALELTWTIIPLILVVIIFYVGFRGYVDTVVAPRNSYEIQVTAAQWSWQFKYPTGAQSDDLVVPADRPVRLVMRSLDVIHSLFIPDFRVKKDVVPGRYTSLWFNAPVPTGMERFHWLFCTEYCGTSHSDMNRKVHVLDQASFDEWLEKQGRWLDDIPEAELYYKAGPKIYARCAQCHSTNGTIGTGPSWGRRDGYTGKTIWERTLSGETKLDNGKTLGDLIGPGKEFETPEEYLRQSILNPAKHLVNGYGNAMPTFQGQLSPKAIDAIIDYMKHIEEFDSKGQLIGGAPPSAAPAPQS